MRRITRNSFCGPPGSGVLLLFALLVLPLQAQEASHHSEQALRLILEARATARLGRYQDALTKLRETVVFAETANDPLIAAIAHSNIAEIYRIHGNATEAMDQFQKAISIYQEIGHASGIALTRRLMESLKPQEPADGSEDVPEEITAPQERKSTSLRTQLIDEAVERIRKRIQRQETREASLPPPSDYDAYLASVRKAIIGAWSYPEQATLRKEEGKVDLEFTILQDGRLGNVRIVKSSGFETLDRGAMQAVRVAAPFHPIPDKFGIGQITIEFTFNYVLEERRTRASPEGETTPP